ncbi:hypothetical protein PENSPDRAFT_603604 [Peniophora sp. CONT]|nr:hypothetical protein PENSPDRAFT_603604 [Peniophora sp. CONT]
MNVPPSLLGGVGLALSAHTLLALNGSVFGISGFLHRAVRGAREGAVGVLALVVGGFIVGKLEGADVSLLAGTSVGRLVASGLLVGLGTKLANGCTSGHMLCGLSRFSARSLTATLTFFTTGALTTRLLHDGLPSAPNASSAPTDSDLLLLAGTALSLGTAWAVSALRRPSQEAIGPKPVNDSTSRTVVQFFSALGFGLSLHVSRLVDPNRVLGFLLLPIHPAFDPALLYLAIGAMPLLTILYWSGATKLQNKTGIDGRLLAGAAIFGVGWGLDGICPGPGLVNFGHALAVGQHVGDLGVWLAAAIAGGLLV